MYTCYLLCFNTLVYVFIYMSYLYNYFINVLYVYTWCENDSAIENSRTTNYVTEF